MALVEHYWHLPLRLQLEEAELRREIEQAKAPYEPGERVEAPLRWALASVDRVVGGDDDRRQTSDILRATAGVVGTPEDVGDLAALEAELRDDDVSA